MEEKKIWIYYTKLTKNTMPAALVAEAKQQRKQSNDIFFVPITDDIKDTLRYLPRWASPATRLYKIKDRSEFNINPLYPEYLIKFLTGLFTSNIDLNSDGVSLYLKSGALLDKTINQWIKGCSIQTEPGTWPTNPTELLNLITKVCREGLEFNKYFDWQAIKDNITSDPAELLKYPHIGIIMDNLLTLAWGDHIYKFWNDCNYMLIIKKDILGKYGDAPDYLAPVISYITERGITYKYAITDDSYNTIEDVPKQLFVNEGFVAYAGYYNLYDSARILPDIVEKEGWDPQKYSWDEYNGIRRY